MQLRNREIVKQSLIKPTYLSNKSNKKVANGTSQSKRKKPDRLSCFEEQQPLLKKHKTSNTRENLGNCKSCKRKEESISAPCTRSRMIKKSNSASQHVERKITKTRQHECENSSHNHVNNVEEINITCWKETPRTRRKNKNSTTAQKEGVSNERMFYTSKHPAYKENQNRTHHHSEVTILFYSRNIKQRIAKARFIDSVADSINHYKTSGSKESLDESINIQQKRSTRNQQTSKQNGKGIPLTKEESSSPNTNTTSSPCARRSSRVLQSASKKNKEGRKQSLLCQKKSCNGTVNVLRRPPPQLSVKQRERIKEILHDFEEHSKKRAGNKSSKCRGKLQRRDSIAKKSATKSFSGVYLSAPPPSKREKRKSKKHIKMIVQTLEEFGDGSTLSDIFDYLVSTTQYSTLLVLHALKQAIENNEVLPYMNMFVRKDCYDEFVEDELQRCREYGRPLSKTVEKVPLKSSLKRYRNRQKSSRKSNNSKT